jgi:DNA-binding beta-propeller fold protein YncE
VSIINLSGGVAAATVQTIGFSSFDAQTAALKAAGVRIYDGKLPSTDFEPEYVAVAPDGATAMVTLQEANAVALLDLATATFTGIVPLGLKDWSGLLLDPSDKDNAAATGSAIKLVKGLPVFGQPMPDAVASFTTGGQTYYVVANEGDDRNDFLATPESIMAGDPGYDLDDTAFPNEADLKLPQNLGRLVVCNSPGIRGDTDGDGDIDQILTYGGRSFSILNASGTKVYDSGDLIERGISALGSPFFDDGRSDNKGPEPEGVVVGQLGGRSYAFVALERSRGTMVFDVTDPGNATPAGFAFRNGDRNPEGLVFISPADSPTGEALLVASNETSNNLSIFSVKPVAYTLQLLHLADAEAGLTAPTRTR